MMPVGENKNPLIKEFKEYHTDRNVLFRITMTEENMAAVEKAGFAKTFKLSTKVSTSNMVLFDANDRLRKYQNVQEILGEFFELRMRHYHDRKVHVMVCSDLLIVLLEMAC